MQTDQRDRKQGRTPIGVRGAYNVVMGLLWSGMGLFFVAYRRIGREGDFDPRMAVFFGAVCMLYGGFRLWRAYRDWKGR